MMYRFAYAFTALPSAHGLEKFGCVCVRVSIRFLWKCCKQRSVIRLGWRARRIDPCAFNAVARRPRGGSRTPGVEIPTQAATVNTLVYPLSP